MVSKAGPAALVTVVVPTHDHASTLDLAVTSVLRQTIEAVEVVIIGDGAGDETRDVVSSLLSDTRVRFLDRPKSPSRAELVRHEVLRASRAPYVCYLGDDDLMLPNHIASTVERLQTADLTHPLPAFIQRDGSFGLHLTDISDPRCVAWHLQPGCNAISLTGVGHRLDAYLALPHGWREPPPGTWSDHYMWQQWFRAPSMRYSTGDQVTVLKFYNQARLDVAGAERRLELLDWTDKMAQPGFAHAVTAEAGAAVRRLAVGLSFDLQATRGQVAEVQDTLELLNTELRDARAASVVHATEAESHASVAAAYAAEADGARANALELQRTLDTVRRTRTWRLHDWLAQRAAFRWLANR